MKSFEVKMRVGHSVIIDVVHAYTILEAREFVMKRDSPDVIYYLKPIR